VKKRIIYDLFCLFCLIVVCLCGGKALDVHFDKVAYQICYTMCVIVNVVVFTSSILSLRARLLGTR